MTKNNITWFTENIYIDIDTGEIIPKIKITTKKYIIIQTIKKHYVRNQIGTVEITSLCRRSGQIELDFN